MDTEQPTTNAPIGTQLAVGAAIIHWVSAVILIVGLVSSDGEHSSEWEAKYPEWEGRMKAMGDFSHNDSAPLHLDRMTRMYDGQAFLVFEGLMEAVACVLAICTLMCVKSQMNFRVPADERELICYACVIIGLLIPMLEFCLRAGPIGFCGWVAHEISKPDGSGFYTGFSATHIQTMSLGINVVESLFIWMNTFADFLLGAGFLQLSFLGSKRADIIFDHRTKLVGFWTGGFFIAAGVFGLFREVTISGDHTLWLPMELTVTAISAMLGLFLVPAYFVLLGIGLGRVSSIEDLNSELGDAVTAVGRAQATDRLKSKAVEESIVKTSVSNPAQSELTVAAADDEEAGEGND